MNRCVCRVLLAIVAVLFIMFPAQAKTITSREVVDRCIEAMGGQETVDSFRNMRFLLRRPDPSKNIYWEIQRPNKVRKERPGKLVLVFDGERAGFVMGPPRTDGTLEGPHLVPAEDWHHFEMDIALYVPAFFDHPAEYQGMDQVGETTVHILKVTLPMGAKVIYALDADSFLPLRVSLPAWDYEQYVGDWKKVGDVMYFHRFWSGSDPGDITLLDELAFNVDPGKDRFTVPADGGYEISLGQWGRLAMDLPDGWTTELEPPSVEGERAVVISPARECPLIVQVSVIRNPVDAERAADQVRAYVGEMSSNLRTVAEEKLLTPEGLTGPTCNGLFISITDKTAIDPGRGEYRYADHGAAIVGPLLVYFTILTNEKDAPERVQARELVRNAGYLPPDTP